MKPAAATTLATLRRLLLGLLTFGLAGTAIDLLLIAHYEDEWQLLPLGVIVLAFICVAGVAVTVGHTARGALVLRAFRIVMVGLMLTGGAGSVLHYRANMEFKLEMDPSMSGLPLFWSVVRAKAPPAMAPASLLLLGLLGLAATYQRATDRHPLE